MRLSNSGRGSAFGRSSFVRCVVGYPDMYPIRYGATEALLKMQCRTIVDSSHSNHSVFVNRCIRLGDNELWALMCPMLATTNSLLLAT